MAPPRDTSAMTAPAPDPMVPQVVRVARRRRDAPQVFTLDFEGAPQATSPFAPGQFNMLTVFGVGEIPISVSSDPADRGRLRHTVRAVGPVSQALTRLRTGDVVGLRGPFGTGWPMAEALGQDVVVVAGGLGLAPLRPVLYRLFAERERYGNVALLYGTRSPGDILFRREIESWRRRLDVDIEVTVDHATGNWRGHVGVVTTLIPRTAFDPTQTIALVCGPEVMMRFVAGALRDAEPLHPLFHEGDGF
jgi:NAD(P)H-flavin reductase